MIIINSGRICTYILITILETSIQIDTLAEWQDFVDFFSPNPISRVSIAFGVYRILEGSV